MAKCRIFHDRCPWPAPHFDEMSTLRWLSQCFAHALPGTITNHYPSDFVGPVPPNGYLLPCAPGYVASDHEGLTQFRLTKAI